MGPDHCGIYAGELVISPLPSPEPNMVQGKQALQKGGISLFGKWLDETHHPELVEGQGLREIFTTKQYVFSRGGPLT
jgi:hypothetical protein